MDINVCCGQFGLIPCADDDEHLHIGCDSKSGLDKNPIINNEWAKEHCISEDFKDCPYYPRGE